MPISATAKAGVEDPVEPGVHRKMISAFYNAKVRAAATDSRLLRALDKGAHLVLGARPSHAIADNGEPVIVRFLSAIFRPEWRKRFSWHQRQLKICAH